jgi:hypothetical protein
MMMRVDEEPVHWGRTVAHPNDGGKSNPPDQASGVDFDRVFPPFSPPEPWGPVNWES